MATLVLDIETVGEAWDELDAVTQASLSRWILRTLKSEEERHAALQDLKEGLGFSPLTGRVVAVGVYDLERSHGVVYFDGEPNDSFETEQFEYKSRAEKEILAAFWEGAISYDTFVTFNGRGFDVPFLMLRSAILGVRPTYDLMRGRYLYQQRGAKHIDLQDQLTFYGAVQRRPSLHLFCRAFGIESPKAEGVAGDDVAKLFEEKKFHDIARYNARDVLATAALYEKWDNYLAPSALHTEGEDIDFLQKSDIM